jgi:hypothetical protein
MFERIKENWQKRIEKNAISSSLTYIDKKGIEHNERVIFKRSLLPLGDWARIYPPIDENGKVSWINLIFGGKRNLIKLIAILLVVGFALMQFKDNFAMIEYYKNLVQICDVKI